MKYTEKNLTFFHSGSADESSTTVEVVLFDTSTSYDVNMNDVIARKGIAKPIKEIVETP